MIAPNSIDRMTLSVSNLHVSVGDKPILKGLTLDVPAGEVHAVVGPNGTVVWYGGPEGETR